MTKDMRKDYRGNDEAVNLSSLQVNGLTTKQLVYSGLKTTVGWAAAEVFSVPGMLATDTVFITILYWGASSRYTSVLPVAAANQFTVTFSGDPGAGAKIQYQVFR